MSFWGANYGNKIDVSEVEDFPQAGDLLVGGSGGAPDATSNIIGSLTTTSFIDLTGADGITIGKILEIESNSSDASIRSLASITNTNVGANKTTTLTLNNIGGPVALMVESGNTILDLDSTEAFLVRADGDGGDVFTVNTTASTITIGTSTAVGSILDEDNMASDSATALATQQSIKAYVDASGGGGGTLDQAYDQGGAGVGRSITVDTGAVELTVSNTSNNAGFIVNQNDTTNNPNGVELVNAGTGAGLFLNQDGNGTALQIDTEATTGNGIEFLTPTITTGNVIDLDNLDSLTSGNAIYINSNSASSSVRELVEIINDNTSATACTPLSIKQDANRRAFIIDMNGNGNAIDIDTLSTTANVIDLNVGSVTLGDVISVNNANSLSAGSIAHFSSNSSSTAARDLVFIRNDNTLAVNATCLALQQDAASEALEIDHNGAGLAIYIDKDCNDASDQYAIKIDSDNAGSGNPGGIDLSSMSVDEPNLKFVSDTITSAGTVSEQIAVDVGGTTYYLVAYTHGS
jgi:hypothetical protein